MRRAHHPSVSRIGKVTDTGTGTLYIIGWQLGFCATSCACHRHPRTGQLVLDEDQTGGHLGLVSYAPGGCACCEPWSAYELADVLRDLADIAALSGEPA